MRWRVRVENAAYWLADEPVWLPPDYDKLVRARSSVRVIPPALLIDDAPAGTGAGTGGKGK